MGNGHSRCPARRRPSAPPAPPKSPAAPTGQPSLWGPSGQPVAGARPRVGAAADWTDAETWGGSTFPPYPRPFAVAPGDPVAMLAETEGANGLQQAGWPPELALLARGDDGRLLAYWAPLVAVEYGACALSTGAAPLAAFGEVAFDPPRRPTQNPQLFCAPPLTGGEVRLLARTVRRLEALPGDTLGGLQALAALSAWCPLRVQAELAPLVAQLAGETAGWEQAFAPRAVPPPRVDWGVYWGELGVHSPEGESTFSARLVQQIQTFARRNRTQVHEPLPPADPSLYGICQSIHELLCEQQEWGQAQGLFAAICRHPRTLALAAKDPENRPQRQTVWRFGATGKRPTWDLTAGQFSGVQDLDALLGSVGVLYREEAAAVGGGGGAPCRPEGPFVFDLGEAVGLAQRLERPETLYAPLRARDHLDEYLGGYLSGLDLARPAPSYITGSAAMSSALRPAAAALFPTHGRFLASYYPATLTEPCAPHALHRALAAARGAANPSQAGAAFARALAEASPGAGPSPGPEAETANCVCHRWPSETGRSPRPADLRSLWAAFRPQAPSGAGAQLGFPCRRREGADVDIAVDAGGDFAAFDATAAAHFAAIREVFPDARLEREEKSEGRHMWRVVGSALPGFRTVEIYMAGWGHICTHHVAPVRLAYCRPEGKPPGFYLTVSCVLAALERATPDYYYFASRKTAPQSIILKYARRGYPPKALPARALGGKALTAFPPALSWAILDWAAWFSPAWGAPAEGEAPAGFLRTRPLDWPHIVLALPALSGAGPFDWASLPAEASLAALFLNRIHADGLMAPRGACRVGWAGEQRPWPLESRLWLPALGGGRADAPVVPLLDPEGWNLRAARFFDAGALPCEASGPKAVSALLARLGLETGDFCQVHPKILRGCGARQAGPAGLGDFLLMVFRKDTPFERAASEMLEEGRSPAEVARAAGAEWFHPPSPGAPGFLVGGEPWHYPKEKNVAAWLSASALKAPGGAHVSRDCRTPRPLYGPLLDPSCGDPVATWEPAIPGGPPPAAQLPHLHPLW